ncbi:sodium-coupled monocarboxylate transporter 1 isoform X2 [Bemisia tabaci]|uniref:sodium-coupled monocarboxylate transporter 1 isoform X2 n=1 Tax=Bemisia tabaci TaxID=7038 RepID=UPI0008F9E212|nr:PREDICTED: sodium-coupled monocarboxylate transporter 1 isoform X2 [Bemisia tabaci]
MAKTSMASLMIDYAVFVVLILVSILVAIWSKCSGPKEKTKADYVFATTSVSMAAMLLSIARGFLGVRVFLGYPSELFYRGSEMWQTLYGMVIAFPLISIFFVPVYYSLGITSVYQYLDLRFKSRLVRCLASGTYIIRSVLNLGVTVFTPCVALKAVIGLPYWASIVSITFIGVSFCIMGGLRSAITADVVQGVIMIICSGVIILHGMITAGGPLNVIKIAHDAGRLEFFNSELDPTLRVTTMSAVVGQLFMSLSIFGCQQNFVQRYCSMSSQSKVICSLRLIVPVMIVLFSLSWVVGMVIYANYSQCDPLKLGCISKIDEILPFYLEEKFYFMPGFLGLVMASLFNGALSFLVSNLNSLATVCYEDFVALLPCCQGLSETTQLVLIKLMSVFCGLLVMGTAFVVANMSGVIESSMLMTSATSGPLLGVFLLAMFFPSANWKGAAGGMILSHIFVIWITYGRQLIDKPPEPLLPTSIEGCGDNPFGTCSIQPSGNFTNSLLDVLYDDRPDPEVIPTINGDWVMYLFSLTYMYYALIGTMITVISGLIISYVTSCCSEENEYDENLIHPLALRLSKLFPGKKRCYKTSSDMNGTKSPAAGITTISEKMQGNQINGNAHYNTMELYKTQSNHL